MYTNEQIHALMPYAFVEAEGEPTLLERIMPAYEQQQHRADETYLQWTSNSLYGRTPIVNPTITDADRLSEVRFHLDRWAALSAITMTLSELDLVLTPNGFGIVSNQNIAPASKERVAALKEALYAKQSAQWRLADHIWHTTEVYFRYHLTQKAPWLTYYEVEKVFDEEQVPEIDRLERRMLEKQLEDSLLFLFGEDVTASLLRGLYWNDDFTGGSNYSDTEHARLHPIAVKVKEVLMSGFRAGQRLFKDEQTDYILRVVTSDEAIYEEWKTSTAYKNFKGTRYENKKNSRAFVF